MWIYLVTFSLTLVFSYTNEVNLKKLHPNKMKHFISACMIILAPAIIAALRADSVGVDTLVYAKPVFSFSVGCSSFLEVLNRFSDIEPLFLFVAFLISRISTNFHLFLFFISFIVELFTYLAIYRNKDKCSIFVGEAIFLFFMYNQSFNMMRQSIAMAIMLFGMTYLFERKYITYVLWLFVGYFFHKSIIIGLVFIPLFIFFGEYRKCINSVRNLSLKKIFVLWTKFFVVTIAAFLVVFAFQSIVMWLGGIGIISDRFTNYLNGDAGSFRSKFFIIYLLPVLILFITKNKNEMGYTFLSIELLNIIFFGMQYTIYYLYRISVYFMAVRLFSLSTNKIDFYQIIKSGTIRKSEIISLLGLVFGFFYWYAFIIVNNNHGTANYLFYFN